LRGIPKDREVVAYCRGPHCVLSVEAVELLRKRGYRAQRLDLGVHDWRGLGFAIEATTAGGIAA
jgi:rhodanese-related sulfurtransferase